MVKTLSLAFVGLISAGVVVGQMKKQIVVDNQESCETVDLVLKQRQAIALSGLVRRPNSSPFTVTRTLRNIHTSSAMR